VDKALTILTMLASESHGIALADLARRLGFNQSTAHHLLVTLRQHGFVDQDPQTRAYRLGYGLLRLAHAFVIRTDLYTAGLGAIRELRDRSGEAASLMVLQGLQRVAIIQMVGWGPFPWRPSPFEQQPDLHCSGAGKLLLAYLPPAALEPVLASLVLTPHTPNTIAGLDALRRELAAIRQQGYALDREEIFDGVVCIAAPVFNGHGECVAAADLSLRTVGPPRLDELIGLVVAAAAAISRNLGYVPTSRPQPVAESNAPAAGS
jgi:DNA-binding IclR family transcriptional regulator